MELWKKTLKLGILLTIFSINSYADPLDVVKPEINSLTYFGGKWHINYNELKNGTNLLKEELFVDGNSDRIVTVGTQETRGFSLHGSYATDVCHKAYVVVYDKTHNVVSQSDEFDFGDTTLCGDYVESDDTVDPVLALIGQNPQRVTKGQAYVELGATALDNRDGDLTNSIVIDSSDVDTSTIGDYTVIYDVVDTAGHAVTVTRTVKVVAADFMGEIVIHKINFYGGKWNIRYQDLRKVKGLKKEILFVDGVMVRILTGGYNRPQDRGFAFTGAYAQDACHKAYIVAYDEDDNELSKSAVFEFGDTTKCVEASNDYKITNITYFGGRWNVLYKDVPVSSEYSVEKLYVNGLHDRTVNAGTTSPILNRGYRLHKMYAQDKCHKAYIELFNNVGVKVKTTETFNFGDLSKCDGNNVSPEIQLLGQPVVTIVKGLPYVEEGATANDNEDGDISANIITTGTVNTDIVGDYTINYSITDSGGLQAQISRVVKVVIGQINNVFNDPAVNSEHNVHAVGLDRSNGTLKLILDGAVGDTTFPYIWIANSGEGTISLLSTETGDELGRYRTGPTSGNPSRTTVDQDGNVWVGNRSNNTITKIGLNAWEQCIDSNGNGVIDTSTGSTDIKAWGEDECLLQHVTLVKDGLSANRVRLVAVDADNNVFAGGSSSNALFKVNGETGVIMNAVTTLQNHYGGVIDSQGNIWSMPPNHNRTVQKISHDMSLKENINIGHSGYGITIDRYGKVWTTELSGSHFSTFDPSDPIGTLNVFNQTAHSGAQGVAADSRGNIFIAGNLWSSTVGEYKQQFNDDGNFTGVEFVKNHTVQRGPTGVAVDATGKVWASNYSSNSVSRIDPVTETVDHFPVGRTPYNYSDMTGNIVRNITEKTGTWEATFNGQENNYSWNTVKWRLKEVLPAETIIKVFAKTANEKINLAGKSYIEIQNGIPFNLTGQYLKIKIELVSKNLTDTPEVVEIELF